MLSFLTTLSNYRQRCQFKKKKQNIKPVRKRKQYVYAAKTSERGVTRREGNLIKTGAPLQEHTTKLMPIAGCYGKLIKNALRKLGSQKASFRK